MQRLRNSHAKEVKDVLALLKTGIGGLRENEIVQRINTFGKNIIAEKKKESVLKVFVKQFKSSLVVLLLFAAILSFFFKEWLDGTAILVVILINAVIGFFMEHQAERSMDALKKMVEIPTKVVRDGKLHEINSEMVVPGDVLFLEGGDMIVADARIISATQLQVDESALTGESIPTEKNSDITQEDVPLADRDNMVYKGTFVSRGNAKAVVVATAMETELGKIANMIQNADQAVTPLERKLQQFSKKLIIVTSVLVVVIFIAGLLNGQHILEMLETAIALAVAAIPEGLPIVATLALAQGMLKMASQNVIVKKLSAVETLGGVSVICTDKTGTLTENKIEVGTILLDQEVIDVRDNPKSHSAKSLQGSENFQLVKIVSVLCNTAELIIGQSQVKEIGDPLETGLLKFAHSFGIDLVAIKERYEKVNEVPFSSEMKIMITVHRNEHDFVISAKGAVEELINKCGSVASDEGVIPLTSDLKKNWMARADEISSQGQRTIALAYKKQDHPKDFDKELTLLAVVGLFDPPRQEVASAIRECKSAGIKVVMVTGDHPSTAKNIAMQLGIIESPGETVINGRTMSDANVLSESERGQWLTSRIFARVAPKQKLDLVEVFQQNNQVVAMTGDGVNDAPAIRKADIGIAMGLRGTQVAQQVADIVLKDDSFLSIVTAVRQGRAIFENIRKFIIYLLSCNLSELFVIAIASVLNLHFQLFPLQILFINLITDVLPALALGATEAAPSIMTKSPRRSEESIIGKPEWRWILVYSTVLTITSLGAVMFSHYTVHKMETWDLELCNNILFFTLIGGQLLHVFNMTENKRYRPFNNEIIRNKYVWYATAICVVIVILSYLIDPIRKALSVEVMSSADWIISICF
ncbi:MAG TPA: cation-translocating P-type ATPase, partial [Cyclobacteriaceae bacterium]|nr:cation-translocating P-type ATPase [Cyclobacteriaceae bacterium]